MDEKVQKELKTLRGMVLNWKESHLRCAPSQGGEFLVKDFLEEIETHVYPYVRRMYECDYLTQSEAKEFLDFCYDQVDNLRDSLMEAEAEQPDTKGG
jgi:hypothetical protein